MLIETNNGKTVGELKTGDAAGFASFLLEQPLNVSISCLSNVSCFKIKHHTLKKLFKGGFREEIKKKIIENALKSSKYLQFLPSDEYFEKVFSQFNSVSFSNGEEVPLDKIYIVLRGKVLDVTE